jgi:hypothetical protein
MTRHPIAQIAPNRYPKSQEIQGSLPISCGIDYFTRRVLPGALPLPPFFTDD